MPRMTGSVNCWHPVPKTSSSSRSPIQTCRVQTCLAVGASASLCWIIVGLRSQIPLLDFPLAIAQFGRRAGQHDLATLHHVGVVRHGERLANVLLHSRVPTTSAKRVPSAATMRSHAHINISPAAYTLPCTWAMVIFRRFRQRSVYEEVVPLLKHSLLRALPGTAIRHAGEVLTRSRCQLFDRFFSIRGRDRQRRLGQRLRESRRAPGHRLRPSRTRRSARRASRDSARFRLFSRLSMIRAIRPSYSDSYVMYFGSLIRDGPP